MNNFHIKSLFIVAIAVALALNIELSHQSRNGQNNNLKKKGCSTNYKFDYLLMAIQWGPGYCRTSPRGCEKEPKKIFTLHGLWPNLWPATGIHDCCFDNFFNIDALAPIMDDMYDFWPSLNGPAVRFWSHEWLKHGTCARDVPQLHGELTYFSTTLTMFKSLEILDKLAKSNISPSNDKQIKADDLIDALKQVNNGKTPQLNCDYEHHHSVPVLTGLYFCFDTKLSPIDCNVTSKKCSKFIILPESSEMKAPDLMRTVYNYLRSIFN